MIGILFYGAIVLTYALPWVKVADEWYAPGQLVIPYAKFFLTKAGILSQKEDSPPTIGDVFTYEKSLRYLSSPPEEGGPHNQITFELMSFSMLAVCVLLLVPLRIFKVISYISAIATDLAFAAAMLFYERKDIKELSFGLFSNIGCSLVFLILTFIL